jgi:asparagine synthase (glutamine-hydrolysing)
VCGICGIVSLRGAAVDVARLAAMNETLRHRGPDSGGVKPLGQAGLAARRLSIIDLAGGEQPMANEDDTVWVVQNGEIYNYPELRREVLARGHRLKTNCDTEVHLHLYEDFGPRYVERLRGMFAVALWDTRERRLVAARDTFGIKPLYYAVGDGELSFASELKALLGRPGFSRELDLDALEAFLEGGCVPAPLTIFRSARKLPQGHLLLWREGDGAPTIERFARPAPVARGDVRTDDDDVLAEELRARLRDSVRAHLLADVPVGVLLSGGVDSSAITALAAEESGEPLHTFSIGFEEQRYNELDKARMVAQRYGTQHHELIVRADIVDLFPRVVEAFDEPFADDAAIPTYLLSELASRDVKVALSGDGGDELFGGYDVYGAHALAPALRPLREVLRRLPSQRVREVGRAVALPPLQRHRAWKEMFGAEARTALLDPARRGGADPLFLHQARWDESEGSEELSRILDLDVGTYLVDELLVKVDRASMAHSLETRVPFLDPVVADFALSLPAGAKVRDVRKKRLLRKALAPLVPAEILGARKHGFTLPASQWLRTSLAPYAREMLSPANVGKQGVFRPEAVTRLLDEHIGGRRDNWKQVWTLLAFTAWYDSYAA